MQHRNRVTHSAANLMNIFYTPKKSAKISLLHVKNINRVIIPMLPYASGDAIISHECQLRMVRSLSTNAQTQESDHTFSAVSIMSITVYTGNMMPIIPTGMFTPLINDRVRK